MCVEFSLLHMILFPQLFQLFNAYTLYRLSFHPYCSEWQVRFLCQFVGRRITSLGRNNTQIHFYLCTSKFFKFKGAISWSVYAYLLIQNYLCFFSSALTCKKAKGIPYTNQNNQDYQKSTKYTFLSSHVITENPPEAHEVQEN